MFVKTTARKTLGPKKTEPELIKGTMKNPAPEKSLLTVMK